jgi:hypothetical protein
MLRLHGSHPPTLILKLIMGARILHLFSHIRLWVRSSCTAICPNITFMQFYLVRWYTHISEIKKNHWIFSRKWQLYILGICQGCEELRHFSPLIL